MCLSGSKGDYVYEVYRFCICRQFFDCILELFSKSTPQVLISSLQSQFTLIQEYLHWPFCLLLSKIANTLALALRKRPVS